MKNIKSALFVVLAVMVMFVPLAIAQSQVCDAIVLDQANMLSASGMSQVTTAVNSLIAQGADVRVRTIAFSPNLDISEGMLEKNCPSWQSANGGRKSTLVVIMLSGNRKAGIVYGNAWHKALDGNWNRIMVDYMFPRFRTGDYAGGVAAGLTQLSSRIVASKDETIHPVQHNTTVQAPDYKGLWTVLLVFVIFGAIGLVVWALSRWYKYRSDRLDREENARIMAQYWLNQCNTMILSLKNRFAVDPPETSVQTEYDNCMSTYSDLQNSSKMDPNQADINETGYNAIINAYRDLYNSLRTIGTAHTYTTKETSVEETPVVKPVKTIHHPIARGHRSDYIEPPTTAPVQTAPTTIVVHEGSSGDGLVEGMVIGSMLNNHNHDYDSEERVRRQMDLDRQETERKASFSHHEEEREEESGGSSSWGSSSDSSSDSGGSSSFDSGSSGGFDSGGGGSSDF